MRSNIISNSIIAKVLFFYIMIVHGIDSSLLMFRYTSPKPVMMMYIVQNKFWGNKRNWPYVHCNLKHVIVKHWTIVGDMPLNSFNWMHFILTSIIMLKINANKVMQEARWTPMSFVILGLFVSHWLLREVLFLFQNHFNLSITNHRSLSQNFSGKQSHLLPWPCQNVKCTFD